MTASPTFDINHSVAFVTGTNKKNGIGHATVEALVRNGADKVYATARKIDDLVDLAAKYPGKVVPVALDVTDLASIEGLGRSYPDVNLVVNNAGYLAMQTSLGSIEAVQQEIAVNYIAPMAIVKSFAPSFQEHTPSTRSSKPTAVVNISSIASYVNFPIAATYSASKAASHSLTQAQRRDLPSSLVVGVYPGPIDTDMAEKVPYDKTPPSAVADAIVEALKAGTEDIFPDPMAVHLHDGWKADAKALEQQMAQPAAESEAGSESQ